MEPYLSTFAFSNDINQINDGQSQVTNIINPQNLFRPTFVPGTFSFAVTFGILGMDPDKEHTLQYIMTSPNGEAIVQTQEVKIERNPSFDTSILPKEANGFIFNMDFRNLAFREKGKYIAHVIVNDHEVGSIPVMVYPQELQ